MLLELYDWGRPLLFAEQNNGYIWQNFLKVLYRHRSPVEMSRIRAVNTLGPEGRPRFIHSGTYEELIAAFGLAPEQLAATVRAELERGDHGRSSNPRN
jgi:hypothetical protein